MMAARLSRLMGRLRALPAQSYYTLSGWRFADLKQHIDTAVGHEADATLAMLEFGGLRASAGRARLAIVTCLPPAPSGIANFSNKHLQQMPAPVDVYSPVQDVGQFLRLRVALDRRSGGNAALYPLASLLARDEAEAYDKIVFVLGNSNHNIETYRMMETFSGLGGVARAACYLHDPCCHNVVQMAKGLGIGDYMAFVSTLYGTALGNSGGLEGGRGHRSAVDLGILGTRAISALGIRHFIVNSRAAAELLQNDLSVAQAEQTRIDTLYHPVLPAEVEIGEVSRGDTFTVGSFGAAGYAKGTDVVVDAVRLMRERGHRARLVLAGYFTRQFMQTSLAGRDISWIEHAEPQTERELQLDMLKSHVAVQLRRENLGESSGIVPTLIGLGIPTIVSPVGAFAEYGNSVVSFDGYDPSALADLLQQRTALPAAALQRYAEQHGVPEFNRRLLELVLPPGRLKTRPKELEPH